MEELRPHRQLAGLEIRRVPLASLHLDPSNARSHPEANLDAIVASLRRFEQVEPLVVQKSTGRVIGGNGRLVAMKKLGWSECDVVEVDVDDLTATSLAIALNRTAELAEWDEPVLAQLLEQLRDADSLDGVGFSNEEIDALLAELLDGQDSELEDPGPGEIPEKPVSRTGDLWILGDHRLLCGDSTQPDDLARLMAGQRAVLLATDPPYLVDYQGGNHPQSWANRPETRDKHWDDYQDSEQGLAFFTGWLRTALPHCIDSVPVYQWHAHRRQALVEQAWVESGLLVHQQLIWVKAHPVLTRSMFMWQHEPCFFGWPKGSMPSTERRPPNNETTIWQVDQVGQQDGVHPTQKPVELFERPIRFHTRAGELVLEPFSGSGTQLIAAEKLKRRCRAVEISPAFTDVGVCRFERATKQQAVLEATGQSFAEVAKERVGGDTG